MITCGLDIGSTYTKAAVLSDLNLIGHATVPTGVDAEGAARRALNQALNMAGLRRDDLSLVFSTGYGRSIVEVADRTISEITANARGARWVGSEYGTVRTIIDIGGQDTKVISLNDSGDVRDFLMNDRCAAGTGRFLDVISKSMGVTIDDLGRMAMESQKMIKINATCTVFARSEVVSLLARGVSKQAIASGLHCAIARRVGVMARKVGIRDVVIFDGGPARNPGMRAALEEELGLRLVVPERPQIVTAIGAALLAAERLGR